MQCREDEVKVAINSFRMCLSCATYEIHRDSGYCNLMDQIYTEAYLQYSNVTLKRCRYACMCRPPLLRSAKGNCVLANECEKPRVYIYPSEFVDVFSSSFYVRNASRLQMSSAIERPQMRFTDLTLKHIIKKSAIFREILDNDLVYCRGERDPETQKELGDLNANVTVKPYTVQRSYSSCKHLNNLNDLVRI